TYPIPASRAKTAPPPTGPAHPSGWNRALALADPTLVIRDHRGRQVTTQSHVPDPVEQLHGSPYTPKHRAGIDRKIKILLLGRNITTGLTTRGAVLLGPCVGGILVVLGCRETRGRVRGNDFSRAPESGTGVVASPRARRRS